MRPAVGCNSLHDVALCAQLNLKHGGKFPQLCPILQVFTYPYTAFDEHDDLTDACCDARFLQLLRAISLVFFK